MLFESGPKKSAPNEEKKGKSSSLSKPKLRERIIPHIPAAVPKPAAQQVHTPVTQRIKVTPIRTLGKPLFQIPESSQEADEEKSFKSDRQLKSKEDLYQGARILELQEKYSEALGLFKRAADAGHLDARIHLKQIYMDDKLCEKFDEETLLDENLRNRTIIKWGMHTLDSLKNIGADKTGHSHHHLFDKVKKELRPYLAGMSYADGQKLETEKHYHEALNSFYAAALNNHIGAKVELLRICSLGNSKRYFVGSKLDYNQRSEIGRKWATEAICDYTKLSMDPFNDDERAEKIQEKIETIGHLLKDLELSLKASHCYS